MANEEQLAILKSGVEAWNAWRTAHADERVDLRGADLSSANLHEANLSWAVLTQANFAGADLSNADLTAASLTQANLRHADLTDANLFRADLSEVDLCDARASGARLLKADLTQARLLRTDLDEADLGWANLTHADLSGANMNRVALEETVLSATNLRAAWELHRCEHWGPSTVDHRTLAKSGPLPLEFLRGVGLPDGLIDYLPSLLSGDVIQRYSCFISYASRDNSFAERLYADLQNKDVRCWYAPEHLKIGVASLSWTPEYWGRQAPDEESRCREHVRPTRPSSERKRLS